MINFEKEYERLINENNKYVYYDSANIRGKQLGGQDTIEIDTITLARIFEADRQRDIIMRADREKYEKELAKKTAATMKELIQKELAKII